MKKVFVLLSSVVLLGLVLTACGPQATPAAPAVVTVVVTQAPAATPTTVPPTAAATPVATVDPTTLVQPGKLEICSDIPYPPMEFYVCWGLRECSYSQVPFGNARALRMARRRGKNPEFQSFLRQLIYMCRRRVTCRPTA